MQKLGKDQNERAVTELPATTRELLEMLDKSIPHSRVMANQDREVALVVAGARELVDSLMELQAEQDGN